MKNLSECVAVEVARTIHREEEGKEIFFRHNEYELVCEVISVEKCVFNKVVGGKRCDFLFLFNKTKQEYNFLKNSSSLAFYVELKGVALVEACEQLLNSIEKTKDEIVDFDITALVVSSRKFVPKYDNNEYYRDLKRIIRKNIQFGVTPHTITF